MILDDIQTSADSSEAHLTTLQVILWWESRRPLYNLTLLVIGFLSIVAMQLIMNPLLPLGEDAVEPLALIFGSILFGLAANVFYTLGWVVELVLRKIGLAVARRFSVLFFWIGFLFSCLLTMLPFWIAAFNWTTHHLGLRHQP